MMRNSFHYPGRSFPFEIKAPGGFPAGAYFQTPAGAPQNQKTLQQNHSQCFSLAFICQSVLSPGARRPRPAGAAAGYPVISPVRR